MSEKKYFHGTEPTFPGEGYHYNNYDFHYIEDRRIKISTAAQRLHTVIGSSTSVAPQPQDWEPVCASNLFPVFYPENILPSVRGTDDNQIVGNQYKWLNTMVDFTISPLLFLNRVFQQHSAAFHLNAINKTTPHRFYYDSESGQIIVPRITSTVASNSSSVGLGKLVDNGTADGQFPIYGDVNPQGRYRFWGNPTYQQPGVVPANIIPIGAIAQPQHTIQTDQFAPTFTLTGNGGALSDEYAYNTQTHVADPANNAYEMAGPLRVYEEQSPMYLMPSYRPYYYCRLLVFKLKMSLSDYTTFRVNFKQQENFINNLFWSREDGNGLQHMSVRTNDLQQENPFGGMFTIKMNKLLRINPFSTKKIRINLSSYTSKGDLITIKDGSPFVDHNYNYPFFSNGLYVAYLIPPIDINTDMDDLTAYFVSKTAFYSADGDGTVNTDMALARNETIWSAPFDFAAVRQPGVNNPPLQPVDFHPGTTLHIGSTTILSRTCYLD